MRAAVPIIELLDQRSFSLDRVDQILSPHDHDHDHDHDHNSHCQVHDCHDSSHNHHHHVHKHHAPTALGAIHDKEIGSVSLTSKTPIDGGRFTRWLDQLLAEKGQDIFRAKGIIHVAGEDKMLVFQAVHMILEGELGALWREGDNRVSRAVFIGRNLDHNFLRSGFEACKAD
jgi:G3E family GTPase